MFSNRGLFHSLPCPRQSTCSTLCPFSHVIQQQTQPTLVIPTSTPTLPKKRPLELTAPTTHSEPPSQRVRTAASIPKPVQHAHSSVRSYFLFLLPLTPLQTGAPVLRINAAQSQVALPVRQVCDPFFPAQSLTASHRPCSRASTTTLSSSTKTSSLQTRHSPPNMPCAKKRTCTETRQSSPIAMCALSIHPHPSLTPL